MAIAFVNGAVATSAAAGVTGTVTYAPVAGNFVSVEISCPNTITAVTCHDNNNNTLTLNTFTPNQFLWQFYGNAVSGASAYTLAWTNSRVWTAGIVEYSGVQGVGVTGIVNSATNLTCTASLVTTAPNDWIIAAFGCAAAATQTYAAVLGNVRESVPFGTRNLAMMDNTAAASGATVTASCAMSSSAAWQSLAFEALSTVTAVATTSNWLGKQVGTGVNKHS